MVRAEKSRTRAAGPSAGRLAVGFALGLFSSAIVKAGAERLIHATGGGAPAAAQEAHFSIKDVLLGAFRSFSRDRIPSAAAASTFYALLALFPALAAFVSLYGLVADVHKARAQIVSLAGILPGGAVQVLGDQLTRLTSSDHAGLGLAFATGLIASLISANAGAKSLIEGLNVAYEETEKRGFLKLNLVSLTFTIGAILVSIVAIVAVVAAPALLKRLGLGGLAPLSLLRWPLMLVLVSGVFSLLYRFGPCRRHARWRWIMPGGVVASIVWMAMSLVFSWYVEHFGHYNATYGSLGAAIGFMTWIWLSLTVILFGAELDAELEKRTRVDTTIGPPRPMGQRGAAVADRPPVT